MKLRLARKIYKVIGTPAESRYPPHLRTFAIERVCRTRDSKMNQRMWNGIMDWLGAEGRAKMTARYSPAMALDILMRTPEENWKGDPEAWPFVKSTPAKGE
jgi:hypothetical protein